MYPRALFVLAGWYPPRWWEGDEAEQEDLMTRYDCSAADRESVIEYIIAPRKAGRTFTDPSARADSGIVNISVQMHVKCVIFFIFSTEWHGN